MYARNPDFLQHKRPKNKVTLRTLQHFNKQVDNILAQCEGEPNPLQRQMIKTALQNVAYYANHPELNRSIIGGYKYRQTLQKSVRLAKKIRMDTTALQAHL